MKSFILHQVLPTISFRQLAAMRRRYTVYLTLIHFNNPVCAWGWKVWHCLIGIFQTRRSGSVYFSDCSLLAPDQHICSPSQSEKMYLDRKQNLSLPGTLCSPLCSKVLTDRNMKSESGPIQALPLQAQAKPAVGSYGASYVTCSSFPMNPSSSSHAMLCIKLLISNSDNTCRSAPHLFPCTV